MTITAGCILAIGCVLVSFGQEGKIRLKLVVDGQEQPIGDSAQVSFESSYYNRKVDIRNGVFLPPKTDTTHFASVTFYVNDYILSFDSIAVASRAQEQNWVLGIDNKPFEKAHLKSVRGRRRRTYIIYYLSDGFGTITVSKWR